MTPREALGLHYIPNARLSPRSIKTYGQKLSRWEAGTGNPPVIRITTATFLAFRQWGRERYAADSIETTVATVMRILRLLGKLGVIGAVPWEGRHLATKSIPGHVPTPDQLGLLYRKADVAQWPCHMDPGTFWRAVFAVDYWTGLRRGDLTGRLLWENVTEDRISVQAGKTLKLHNFPMHPVVWRHLETLPRIGPRVFQIGNCESQWNREVRRMNDAAGLSPRITAHCIRRLACTEWQAAKWGAGETIQGSAIRGSAKLYIVPRILVEAGPLLRWPSEMLTRKERDDREAETQTFLKTWKRLSRENRRAVAALAEKLA